MLVELRSRRHRENGVVHQRHDAGSVAHRRQVGLPRDPVQRLRHRAETRLRNDVARKHLADPAPAFQLAECGRIVDRSLVNCAPQRIPRAQRRAEQPREVAVVEVLDRHIPVRRAKAARTVAIPLVRHVEEGLVLAVVHLRNDHRPAAADRHVLLAVLRPRRPAEVVHPRVGVQRLIPQRPVHRSVIVVRSRLHHKIENTRLKTAEFGGHSRSLNLEFRNRLQ